MAETLRDTLQRLNEQLAAFTPYKLDVVDPNELELLEKNARFMAPKVFQQLVANIRRDGNLQGVPFCWKTTEGKYRVLSGNHRVKSARAAGIKSILVMYTDLPLSEAERVAIQLAHNALVGQDNMQILRELWESIEDLDLRAYTGLESTDFDRLPTVKLDQIKEEPLDFEVVAFVFTKREREALERAIEAAGKVDCAFVADRRDFDEWLKGLLDIKASLGIINSATAMMVMVEVFNDHIADLADLEKWQERRNAKDDEWVPLRTILGTDGVPRQAAEVIRAAVQKMMKAGEVTEKNRWQALEYLAADYLGTPDTD